MNVVFTTLVSEAPFTTQEAGDIIATITEVNDKNEVKINVKMHGVEKDQPVSSAHISSFCIDRIIAAKYTPVAGAVFHIRTFMQSPYLKANLQPEVTVAPTTDTLQ